MGCDIHQYNFIYQEDGTWLFEGEGIGDISKALTYKYSNEPYFQKDLTDESARNADKVKYFYEYYHSDFIPELEPGRNYQVFGVLAGVRGDDYVIPEKWRRTGYPKQFTDIRASYVLMIDKHSPTWYTCSDLLDGLENAVKEIDADIAKHAGAQGDYIAALLEDLGYLKERLQKMLSDLGEAKLNMTEEQFGKSVILFDFDS